MEPSSPLIFISYVTPDRERVTPFYESLSRQGYDVWMDVHRLKAGQNWDFEIRRGLDKATIVVVFISNNSVNRRGYAQREVKLALEKAEEKLVDDIYLVPVLLDDDARVPDQIRDLQFVRASSETCQRDIDDAVRHQLERLGAVVGQVQESSNIRWHFKTYKDSWDGVPGYDGEARSLRFSSNEYPNICDISDLIDGFLAKEMMSLRLVKFDQEPERFNYGQERFRRTNTFDAHCGEPTIVGKMINIVCTVHTYYAGSAHPNTWFRTFSFVIEPIVHIENLEMIFNNTESVINIIQTDVRRQLLTSGPITDGDNPAPFDEEWVNSGTDSWSSFESFVFRENGVEFIFAPYQVASYADGPQFVVVEYKELVKHMKKEYRSVLGLDYFDLSDREV